jgi:hypothetical protein
MTAGIYKAWFWTQKKLDYIFHKIHKNQSLWYLCERVIQSQIGIQLYKFLQH